MAHETCSGESIGQEGGADAKEARRLAMAAGMGQIDKAPREAETRIAKDRLELAEPERQQAELEVRGEDGKSDEEDNENSDDPHSQKVQETGTHQPVGLRGLVVIAVIEADDAR